MHPFRGPEASRCGRVGHLTDGIAGRAGTVEDLFCFNKKMVAGKPVLDPGSYDFSIFIFFKTIDFQIVGDRCAAFGSRQREQKGIPRVVKLPVKIGDRRMQRPLSEAGQFRQNLFFRQKFGRGKVVFQPGHPVVDFQADKKIDCLDPSRAGRDQFERPRQKGRTFEHGPPLVKAVAHLFQLIKIAVFDRLFEVSDTAVDELRAFGGCCRGKIARINERDPQPAARRIERAARP